MLDPDGVPVKRNFVHVTDLVDAMLIALDHPKAGQQTFNICMDEPVDYRELAHYLNATRGLPSVDVKTPIGPLGWTTARPDFCWAGDHAWTCLSSSKPLGVLSELNPTLVECGMWDRLGGQEEVETRCYLTQQQTAA